MRDEGESVSDEEGRKVSSGDGRGVRYDGGDVRDED